MEERGLAVARVHTNSTPPVFRPHHGAFATLTFLVLSLALLYAFPWLRIPNVFGVAIPVQRLLAWSVLPLLFAIVCVKGTITGTRNVIFYLTFWLTFLFVVILSVTVNYFSSQSFNFLRAAMEVSKYGAVFGTGYFIYYALKHQFVSVQKFNSVLVLSGALGILTAFALLTLYWMGFRTNNEVLTNSFGGALGVWPTGSFMPRLAGTTAEPQQFSVIFLTPLMIMLTRRHLKKQWFIAVLGVLALVLSQSKFVVVSLLALALFIDLVYRKYRLVLISSFIVFLPIVATFITTLPVFSTTLQQGLGARAFTERFENIQLLSEIIENHWLLGIGVGQYGTYRGMLMFRDPLYDPNYVANSDMLSLFAESGIFGFALMAILLIVLFIRFAILVPKLSRAEKEMFLPYLIGAVAIFTNMFIGYELLHVFFWINIGVLLYLHEAFFQRAENYEICH